MPELNDYTNPERTIRLLDELERVGFGNGALQCLHHRKRSTIESNRKYCGKRKQFRLDRTNSDVQRRLEIVLRAFWGGGFDCRTQNPGVFLALSKAAVDEVPIKE